MSTSCPHVVEAVPGGAPLWCRAMSQTPTYDQVRGERINADIPASEADPHEVDHSGKHRLLADVPLAAVCGSSPGPGTDLAEGRPGFATGDSDCAGRHCLRADVPLAAAVCGPSPGLGADHVEGWSWFETGGRGRAAPATATRPIRFLAGTSGGGHTPAANQQAATDQRETSEQIPQALLPPPAHARDRRQPGRPAPAATRKPTP